MTTFKKVNPKQSFPKMEEEIMKFWREEKIFEESIKNRIDSPEFNFYDGPPFATGTPHYGHILAGTIKDVIPRYQTMKGFRVDRKFGWDCHGLPIENIVEKKLGISGKDDIEQIIGVCDFNESCRANVLTYVDEWKKTVERMGRWVDMENDYKTMDTDFMESVWWVFKSIYDKGLIYEGHRVVPYCPRCSTPLSNFEVNQGYKDKQDKTATVKFKVKGSENKYILAWTTTPWTLVANLGLAVGEELIYVELLDKNSKETYILAKERIGSYYKNEEDYSIMREYQGKCLVGIKYEPIFDDFWTLNEANMMPLGMELGENSFSVVVGHHVTTESGTGIVHIAPAYGEDDNIIGKEQKLGFVGHIADNGNTENLLENNGVQVFVFNDLVLKQLKDDNKVVQINTIDHSYPHCWRCESPLIYRAISAWYVAVEKIRDKMIANNQKINWTPEIIKNGRFGKWLEGARDWNISRNRYWGSAIPVWQNDDKSEEVCVGSIEELYELNLGYGQIEKKDGKYIYTKTNQEVDLHKHFVDEIFVANKNNSKAKKVLGIHGWHASSPKNQPPSKWYFMRKHLEKNGATFDVPEFDKSENTKYSIWKEDLEKYKVNDYDTIVAASFGCPVILQYLKEKNIHIKRLVLQAPSGLKGNKYLEQILNEFTFDIKEIKDYCDELIITCSRDDESDSASFEYSKKFAKESGANFIEVDGIGHRFNGRGGQLLAELSLSGTPLKRITEVLDCWFESGAMPYASKHYPFALKGDNKIKNIVFDFGGVMVNYGTKEHTLKSIDNDFDAQKFLADFPEEIHKSYYSNDNIIYDKIGEFLNGKYTKTEMLNNLTSESIVNINLLEQIPKLSEKYNLYIISNIIPEIIPAFLKKYNLQKYFKGVIESNKEGFKKPDEKLFQALFDKCNIDPKESVFIDDKESNVKVGEKLGMKGLIYSNKTINIENYVSNLIDNFKFPADFIAEGLDQTRGWFYTLLILGTALFNEAPMKNIIVNGTVLAEDGFKMSKSKKNYPDPQIIFDNYGADAMRFYLMNSPVVEAQDFRFAEAGVEEVVKKVILPLWNTYYFFTTYANIDNFKSSFSLGGKDAGKADRGNNLDKWLISELNELTKEVSTGFNDYKLNEASKPIVKFMDNLTNWYIRRSRKRFWKSENDGDKLEAYETLYYTLVEITKIIAPFMPFVSEFMYKNLTGEKSVHLTDFPTYDENLINEQLNSDTDKVQKIITLGLAWRANNKIRVRQPLSSITITEQLDTYYTEIIKEELNVKQVLVVDGNSLAKQICKPNGRAIGPKFGQDVKFIMSEAKSGNFEILENGNAKVGEFELEAGDFELVFETGDSGMLIEAGFGMVIAMNPEITKELKLEGFARDLVRQIQEARKEADYQVDDRIQVCISGADEVLENFKEYIQNETLSTIVRDLSNPDIDKKIESDELNINISLKK